MATSPRTALAINPPVFVTSAVLLLLFMSFGVLATDRAAALFPRALDWVSTYFGWLYVSAVGFFVGFAIWLGASRYGRLRLGQDEDRPEFSRPTWFAMLFSAGMGIGLVFYGVAEPMLHFANPPGSEPGSTPQSARQALSLAFFHWGIHAWAIYVLMGLCIAYFAYRQNLPLSLRSCFQPLLGRHIYGWPGHLIDILAVFGTLFGLATSLGLGAMQVSAGLEHLFDIPHTRSTQLWLIAIITAAACISLVTGVSKGIRRLSELNLALAATILALVFVLGPTRFIVDSLIENIGRYLATIFTRTFRLAPLSNGESTWMKSWTLFYWGWWIAWAPFVGMFIARISRGRTIREFVAGVLLAPTAVAIVWFSVFGGTALHLELFAGQGISQAVATDVSTAVFAMLAHLPLGKLLSFVAAAVVAIFFVTSSDSASFVVDMLTSGGHPNPPVWQRVFWASAEGACAAVLLYAGGTAALEALQAAVVSIGLPFCVLLLFMCVALVRALRRDPAMLAPDTASSSNNSASAAPPPSAPPLNTTKPQGTAPEVSVQPSGAAFAFDRILVPTDYSQHAVRALHYACELGRRLGSGPVDVLHVTPPPADYLPMDEWIFGEQRRPEQVEARLREAAEETLQAHVSSLPQHIRQQVRCRVEVGIPSRVILRVARETASDLVILGARGQTPGLDVRLGSVADRVVRHAHCPVVTVHPPRDA